jgi:hypothetical protein
MCAGLFEGRDGRGVPRCRASRRAHARGRRAGRVRARARSAAGGAHAADVRREPVARYAQPSAPACALCSQAAADYAHPTTAPATGETLATGGWFRAYFRAIIRLTHTVRPRCVSLMRAADGGVCVGQRRGEPVHGRPAADRTVRDARAASVRGEGTVERSHRVVGLQRRYGMHSFACASCARVLAGGQR